MEERPEKETPEAERSEEETPAKESPGKEMRQQAPALAKTKKLKTKKVTIARAVKLADGRKIYAPVKRGEYSRAEIRKAVQTAIAARKASG